MTAIANHAYQSYQRITHGSPTQEGVYRVNSQTSQKPPFTGFLTEKVLAITEAAYGVNQII